MSTPLPTIDSRMRTMADIVRVHAACPDRSALVFGDRASTWLEWDRQSSQVAQGLLAFDPTPGERVGFLGPLIGEAASQISPPLS